MDNIVREAMMRWPDVPAVYGWLQLNRRGNWLIKNELITNQIVTAFINRNYLSNDLGEWYFQNGPQRVFVDLEYTPYIYRIWRNSDGNLNGETHTGVPIEQVTHCWLDDAGNLLLASHHGIGYVEAQSLEVVAAALCDGAGNRMSDNAIETLLSGNPSTIQNARLNWRTTLVPIRFIASLVVPEFFGFKQSPQPPDGQPSC